MPVRTARAKRVSPAQAVGGVQVRGSKTKRPRKRKSRRPSLRELLMSDPSRQRTLLDELESRQTEALDRIEELNSEIEQVVEQWISKRDAASSS